MKTSAPLSSEWVMRVLHAGAFAIALAVSSLPAALQAQTPTADLSLGKSVSNPTPNVGDTVTFTVTASNNGPDPATNVTVTDLLPSGLSFVSATPSQGTYTPATGAWAIGTVTPGVPQTLQIQAQVVTPNARTNTATVAQSDQFDPTTTNNTASATVTPQQADLGLTKSVSNATPNVGDTVTFTITATNNGPDPATNVTVADLLPSGLSFVSATPSQGTYTPATGAWAIGTVTPGGPQTLQIQAQVVTPDPRTNTATVSHSDQFDPSTGNNAASATVTPQQADIDVVKGVDSHSPNISDTVHFTITVVNIGPDDATNVTLIDLLPAGLTFVSAVPSQGAYDPNTGVWSVGTVTTTMPQTLVITATVTSAGPLTNTASVSHTDQFDPNTNNNQASASINALAVELQSFEVD